MADPMEVVTFLSVDYDKPVVEIWYGDEMWGEVKERDDGQLDLTIYASRPGEPHTFDLKAVEEALGEARNRLGG